MNDCKPKEKSGTNEVDLTSISNILKVIMGAFRMMQQPAKTIPPPILLAGKNIRPGMSARNLAARIISRYESEIGIPMGDIYSGGENSKAKEVRVISEEVVSMLQTETKVDVAIDPGAIMVTATGSAGPIPVVVQGSNTMFTTAAGGLS